jgi:hypothetical protein
MDPTTRAAFVAWCAEFASSGHAVEMLQEALTSTDAARRDRALAAALSYGIGLPVVTTKLEVSQTRDLSALLTEWEEEQRALPPLIEAAPAADEEDDEADA